MNKNTFSQVFEEFLKNRLESGPADEAEEQIIGSGESVEPTIDKNPYHETDYLCSDNPLTAEDFPMSQTKTGAQMSVDSGECHGSFVDGISSVEGRVGMACGDRKQLVTLSNSEERKQPISLMSLSPTSKTVFDTIGNASDEEEKVSYDQGNSPMVKRKSRVLNNYKSRHGKLIRERQRHKNKEKSGLENGSSMHDSTGGVVNNTSCGREVSSLNTQVSLSLTKNVSGPMLTEDDVRALQQNLDRLHRALKVDEIAVNSDFTVVRRARCGNPGLRKRTGRNYSIPAAFGAFEECSATTNLKLDKDRQDNDEDMIFSTSQGDCENDKIFSSSPCEDDKYNDIFDTSQHDKR